MKRWLAVPILAAVVIAACTKRREAPTAPPPPAWDTVLWNNSSAMFHTTTSGACAPCAEDGVWDSGLMAAGAKFRVVFGPGVDQPGLVHVDSSGVFPYFCQPHQPNMAGSITVNP